MCQLKKTALTTGLREKREPEVQTFGFQTMKMERRFSRPAKTLIYLLIEGQPNPSEWDFEREPVSLTPMDKGCTFFRTNLKK